MILEPLRHPDATIKDTYSPEYKQQDLNVKYAVRVEHETGKPVKEIINCERNLKRSKQPYKVVCLICFGRLLMLKAKSSQWFPNINVNEHIALQPHYKMAFEDLC